MKSMDWMRGLAAAALLGVAAGGCSSEPPEKTEAPRPGRISGRLYPIADTLGIEGVLPEEFIELAKETVQPVTPIGEAKRALEFPVDDPADAPRPEPVEPSFVPGEAVVRLSFPLEETLARLERLPGLRAYRFEAGDWATPNLLSLRFRHGDRVPNEAETADVAARLDGSGLFAYAHPNYYRRAYTIPDDEHYDRMWHYHMLDLESAWAITTGSPDVVIAVLDTGVKEHDDLHRLLPGYDFVSSVGLAGDGDGRDPDPSPVGGWSASHGQHVAGTIGADSNNGIGIPGIDWQARILPVRVLGTRGRGTTLDVVAGINWATGGEVPNVPPNPTPAHVLNLSLGGEQLVQAEQEMVDLARARGAILVAAAGNENVDARLGSFGGYLGVIVVGATDPRGQRAYYSNWGSAVDVMAPGGDLRYDLDRDEAPDGILSLWFYSSGTEPGYAYQQGTSMAAPHVTGLVGLMKAVAPTLGPDQAEIILRATADGAYRCSEGCGSGLVRPAAAIEAARKEFGKAPRLELPLSHLDIGPRASATIPLVNAGDAPLSWFAQLSGPAASHLQLARIAGTIPANAGRTVEITVSRTGLEEGRHEAVLEITAPNGVHTMTLSITTPGAEPPDLGEAQVFAIRMDGTRTVIGGRTTTDASLDYAFSLTVPPGPWYLVATVDRNGDGALDERDLLGYWPGNAEPMPVEVEADGDHTDLEFILEPIGSP